MIVSSREGYFFRRDSVYAIEAQQRGDLPNYP